MDKQELEQGTTLSPRFNKDGLVAAIAVDDQSGEVLMLAWMNELALQKTLETGEAHYWSRSRSELWHKGATSGNVQHVKDLRIDCDQDAVLMRVDQDGHGAACHTGRKSCFYRRIVVDEGQAKLVDDGSTTHFNPNEIYQKK